MPRALDVALRYQLVSPWTNWLVVAARPDGEKALDIPAMRKVPQTLAAGWGGVGAVAWRRKRGLDADPERRALASPCPRCEDCRHRALFEGSSE